MIGGLKPTPRSRRDFSLTRTFGAPSLDLPRRYDVEDEKGDITGPREQEENFCTAYAISEIGSDEFGVPMCAHFQAAAISRLTGWAILNGADMRIATLSGNKIGFLPARSCPYHRQEADRLFLCTWANWPQSLKDEASLYKMPAFFEVDGPYDPFDNYRAALYRHRPDNGIAVGIPWYRSFNSTPPSGIAPKPDTLVSWHAVTVKGFEKRRGTEVIKIRSWSGKSFGRRSYAYFDRETFNALMRTRGSIGYMYKDVPDTLIEQLRAARVSLVDRVFDLTSELLITLKYGLHR